MVVKRRWKRRRWRKEKKISSNYYVRSLIMFFIRNEHLDDFAHFHIWKSSTDRQSLRPKIAYRLKWARIHTKFQFPILFRFQYSVNSHWTWTSKIIPSCAESEHHGEKKKQFSTLFSIESTWIRQLWWLMHVNEHEKKNIWTELIHTIGAS